MFCEDGSVLCSRAEGAGVRWFCFVQGRSETHGAVGSKRMESRLQHRKEAFLMEGLLGRGQGATSDISDSSVTNGIVAGFCRLQLPDIASQDAVKAGVQAGLHVSLLPAFSPFLSLYAVLLFFLV